MDITASFVLPPDVELTPVDELPADLRLAIDSEPGDVAVTRPGARVNTRVVDAGAASLLRRFRSPSTIVAAVIDYAAERDVAPRDILEDCYVLVRRMLVEGLLVGEGSDAAQPIEPTFDRGDVVDGWQVGECIQSLDDTELYRVERGGRDGALKIQRSTGLPHDVFEREAAALRRLAGGVAPTLLADGTYDGRRYLVVEWLDGMPILHAAGRLRALGRRYREDLARLVGSTLDAYADLHAHGLLHGDVHPRNLIVQADGRVRLIDFGYAVDAGSGADAVRAGVGFFFEPELAAAYLNGAPPPPPSERGELYSVAALAYMALVGGQTHRFSVESTAALRQILEAPPLPFDEHGVTGWDAVEGAVRAALAKDPDARYASMPEFAAAVRSAARADLDRVGSQRGRWVFDELVEQVLTGLGAVDPLAAKLPERGPTASVTYGAAGVAYALLRLAQAERDPSLLTAADLWSAWAISEAGDERAFYNRDLDVTPQRIAPASLYHAASGLHLVRALVAHAQGDLGGAQTASASFVAASPAAEPLDPDLSLGNSSTLIGGSLLMSLPTSAGIESTGLPAHCHAVAAQLWEHLQREPPIAVGHTYTTLGMAHGWAGYLYAQLRWAEVTGHAVPDGLPIRLGQLADLAEPAGDGLRWPWNLHQRPAAYMPGWCNGSAGYVFLWVLAHRLLSDDRYLVLAERAAVDAWTEASAVDNLCCGWGGRAYALLALHAATGDPAWLDRAEEVAHEAVLASGLTDDLSASLRLADRSLYKGRVGLAVLASDIEVPARAAMPLFEAEAWRRDPGQP